jgi:hypothetical protein
MDKAEEFCNKGTALAVPHNSVEGVGFSPCHGATREKCVSVKHSESLPHVFHHDWNEHGTEASAIGA